eukprot:gene9969-12648_t
MVILRTLHDRAQGRSAVTAFLPSGQGAATTHSSGYGEERQRSMTATDAVKREQYWFTQMSKTSLDKSKIKFLLLEGVHQSAVDVLKAAGYTSIEYLTGSLPEAQLKEKIADAHFIGIRS